MVEKQVCLHLQEAEGVKAGDAMICIVTAAEVLVKEAGVAAEVESMQGGVAGIGAEDPPEAAGTRPAIRLICDCNALFIDSPSVFPQL